MGAAVSPDRAYQAIVDELVAEPEVETGRMFRGEGLRFRQKFFALLHRDALVVKLPAPRVDELDDAGTGARFDPGHGRLMREWVAVPLTHHTRWPALAREALEFARRNAQASSLTRRLAGRGAGRPRRRP